MTGGSKGFGLQYPHGLASGPLKEQIHGGPFTSLAICLSSRMREVNGSQDRAPTCASSYFLRAPLFERCNISGLPVRTPTGPHAHCAHTVNENPDLFENWHTWQPSDVRVRWPASWG